MVVLFPYCSCILRSGMLSTNVEIYYLLLCMLEYVAIRVLEYEEDRPTNWKIFGALSYTSALYES